jgi:hypothetical protein
VAAAAHVLTNQGLSGYHAAARNIYSNCELQEIASCGARPFLAQMAKIQQQPLGNRELLPLWSIIAAPPTRHSALLMQDPEEKPLAVEVRTLVFCLYALEYAEAPVLGVRGLCEFRAKAASRPDLVQEALQKLQLAVVKLLEQHGGFGSGVAVTPGMAKQWLGLRGLVWEDLLEPFCDLDLRSDIGMKPDPGLDICVYCSPEEADRMWETGEDTHLYVCGSCAHTFHKRCLEAQLGCKIRRHPETCLGCRQYRRQWQQQHEEQLCGYMLGKAQEIAPDADAIVARYAVRRAELRQQGVKCSTAKHLLVERDHAGNPLLPTDNEFDYVRDDELRGKFSIVPPVGGSGRQQHVILCKLCSKTFDGFRGYDMHVEGEATNWAVQRSFISGTMTPLTDFIKDVQPGEQQQQQQQEQGRQGLGLGGRGRGRKRQGGGVGQGSAKKRQRSSNAGAGSGGAVGDVNQQQQKEQEQPQQQEKQQEQPLQEQQPRNNTSGRQSDVTLPLVRQWLQQAAAAYEAKCACGGQADKGAFKVSGLE